MLTIWIHWLFASAFFGGLAFYLLVHKSDPFPLTSEEGIRWNRNLQNRFRSFRWICLLVLLGTGIINMLNGNLAARISTSYGGWLLAKFFLVAILFGLSGIYDYGFREKVSKELKQKKIQGESSLKKALGYGILTIAGCIFLITLNF